MTSYDEQLRADALEQAVTEREDWTHVRTLHHEDGSVTVIQTEDYIESWMSPREDDGNVAHLVMKHRDYVDLDDPDSGLDEAREWFEGRHINDAHMMQRYVAMFRPDIAHYEHHWTVQGHSQSDWAYGYGYVLTEDAAQIAVTPDPVYTHDYNRAHPRSRRFRELAREAFEAELAVYNSYFAGEVYYATHLWVGDPIVEYAEQGAHVVGYEVEQESCGGFLGYDDMTDIAHQFTDSPAV